MCETSNIRKEVFVKAIEYITSGWTTEAYAKDQYGFVTTVFDRNAVCYCMTGAVHKALGPLSVAKGNTGLFVEYVKFMSEYAKTKGCNDILELNDNPFYTPNKEAAVQHLEAIANLC